MVQEERHKREVHRQYAGEGIVVHWEPALCIHFAACIRRAPMVFDPNARPWVEVEGAAADDIAEAILGCPTGALRFERSDGGPQEAPETPTSIDPRRNGPLFVRGDLEIKDASGNLQRLPRAALCRCGGSANKPFCDGAHRTNGFEG